MYNKRSLRIKLFYPPGIWSCWWKGLFPFSILPYGMGVVTAELRKNGYLVEQDDLLVNNKFSKTNWSRDAAILTNKKYANLCLNRGILEPRLNRLTDSILKVTSYKDFDVIGFSILSYPQFLFALLLAEKIKKNTGSIIVFGGAFITLQGEHFFSKYNFIDFMIVGDGEQPFLKLLDFLQEKDIIGGIPSLLYRDNGEVKTNPRKFYNIEDMPLPDFDGLPLDLYRNGGSRLTNEMILPYQISRGCIHSCSFCAQQGFHKVSTKSYDKVIKELRKYSEQYRSNYFGFCDWTINISSNHIDKLCDLFIEKKLDIYWDGWARIDFLNEKLLKKMKKSGCVGLRFGIESGSDKILQLMRKNFTSKQAAQVLELTWIAGIKACVTLMVGFPHETRSDVTKTIQFLKENYRYIFGITSVNIFLLEAQTPIHKNPEEFMLRNLRVEYAGAHRNYFAFDEINGLKWEEKSKQQRKAFRRVLKTGYYYMLTKFLSTSWVPFWLWLLYEKIKIKKYPKYLKIHKIKSS